MVKVYDIETLSNLFTLTSIGANDEKVETFVIHHLRDDREALYEWLLEAELALVGYNNLRFDYPILHYILVQRYQLMKASADRAARMIFAYTHTLNDLPEREREIKWNQVRIIQCDVYRIHHFDNHAKHASLKWVQIGLRWKNVQDMPIHYTSEIVHTDEINLVLDYNLNDVLSTRELYRRSARAIAMRKVLSAKYGLRSLRNANDPKIGQEIILKLIADRMGRPLWELKKMNTMREEIDLSECMLAGIDFNEKGVFKAVKEKMQGTILTDLLTGDKLKGKLKIIKRMDGMKYEFGLGGLHACRASKTYRSNEHFDILSCDVSSYYPNLSIQNSFYPAHLGGTFCEVYNFIYSDRKSYKKGSPENEGLKLALNGAFGKSNDIHSPFYDPKFTMQITINGQLLLAQLCEELTMKGIGRVLMANTDGIEVEVPVEKREEYREVCLAWQEKWKLLLEHKRYKVLATRDVNNYIGIFEDGEVKCKGAYEIEKPLHKDPSMKIVSKAVMEYIVNGTPLSQTIKACKDPYDFMLASRSREDAWFEVKKGENSIRLHKTNRYLVTSTGDYLYKVYQSKKIQKVSAGYPITLVNRIEEGTLENLNINYNYYIMEATKLLLPFLEAQYSLGL